MNTLKFSNLILSLFSSLTLVLYCLAQPRMGGAGTVNAGGTGFCLGLLFNLPPILLSLSLLLL